MVDVACVSIVVVLEEILNTCQRVNLSVAEVGGIGTVHNPVITDGGFPHDVLHLAQG